MIDKIFIPKYKANNNTIKNIASYLLLMLFLNTASADNYFNNKNNQKHNIEYADSIFNVADGAFLKTKYSTALINYMSAYDIYYKNHEQEKCRWSASAIGTIQMNNNNYMNALNYYEKALYHLDQIDYTAGKFIVYKDILTLAKNMWEDQLFNKYYKKWELLFNETSNKQIDKKTRIKYIWFLVNAFEYHISKNSFNEETNKLYIKIKLLRWKWELDDKFLNSSIIIASSKILLHKKKYNDVILLCEEIVSDTTITDIGILSKVSRLQYEAYVWLWDYKNALKYKINEDKYMNKVTNRDKQLEIANLEAKYESEKKDKEIKLKDAALKAKENEAKIAEEKAKRNQIMLWSAWALLFILSWWWIFWYKKHKQTVKAKKEADEQKQIAEQKTEELETTNDKLVESDKHIQDSINYAKNLQNSMLPSKATINKLFNENFVLYKPKDKVSWDFFSVHQSWDTKVVATLDSTWHWVPWVMMSVLWLWALNSHYNYTKDKNIDVCDLINWLNTAIYNQRQHDVKSQDTMEGSIISYNDVTWELNIAWYLGSMFLFPKNSSHNIKPWKYDWFKIKEHIYDIDSSKKVKYYSLKTPWNLWEGLWDSKDIDVNKYITNIDNVKIIAFSDWFKDQFWWDKEKTIWSAKFRSLVADSVISGLDLEDTKAVLEKQLKERQWNTEQTDDITVIGVKLEKKEMA